MNCVKWKLSCDFVSFPLENYCIVNILNTRTFITMFHQSFQSNQLPKHLLILVMFLHVFNSQFVPVQSSLFPNIIVEMTKQFQRVLSKELAMTDFISVFNSHAILGGGVAFENSSQTWLYKTDCKIMEANTCAEEITSVVRLINETFGEHMNKIDLMISMTMNVSTIIKLGDANSFNKIKLPEFPLKIFVNLHENTKCEDLVGIGYGTWDTLVNTERWMTIYPTTKKGFGYPESLIPCSGKAMSQPINKADFLVLNLKFGNTIGVTESYGLFEKRMNSLHENNVRFARHNLHFTVTKKLQTIYYPTPKAVGDDEGHRQLLMKYAERWTTEKGKKIVIQAPFFEPESITEFSLGTFIESNTCSNFNTEIKNLQWYVPSALAAISEHFDALIIKHDQLKTLNSGKVRQICESLKTPNGSKIELNVLVDYSDTLVYKDKGLASTSSCSYNWDEVERELGKSLIESLQNIEIKVLLFQISNSGTHNMTAHAPKEFIERVSSKYKIGCFFRRASFLFLNESKAISVVKACKEIGGSLYILRSEVRLEPQNYHINYHLHYEDTVRQKLEAVNNFRKWILKTDPEATVYIRLDTWATKQVYLEDTYQATAFCNPEIFDANLYIEAIMNWAKLNNIPIILKSAFDFVTRPDFSAWLSFLRPLQSENVEESLKAEALNPYFVFRNYPTEINNWTVDPCVEWTENRPNVGVHYFHNQYIGALFNSLSFMKYGEQEGAYEIMLQFIAQRFSVSEIVVGNNGVEMTKALKESASRNLIDANRQFFISYANPSDDVKLWSTSLRNLLEEIGSNQIPLVKGGHIDLQDVSILKKEIELKNMVARAKANNVNLGILVNSTYCMTIARLVIYKEATNDEILRILPQLNYIVCKDEFELSFLDDPLNMGLMLDGQLYLNRVFQEYQPHLKLYFRVELNVVLNEDRATMEQYLRVLSHFHKFGIAYNVNYFLVQAFDEESGSNNGWWAIQNYTDLSDPYAYVEKESVHSHRAMWYPPVPLKTEKIVTNSQTIIIVASVSSVLLLLFIAISVFFFLRYKSLQRYLSDAEIEEFFNGKQRCKRHTMRDEFDAKCGAEYMKFKSDYDLPKIDLVIDLENILGAGNFGTVYKGVAKGKQAAIKRPNKDCPKGTFKNVLSEVKVLCYIGIHSNVVCFFGAYTKEIYKGILFIATELCSNGSLEKYLRTKTQVVEHQDNVDADRNPQLSDFLYFHELHRFATGISNGMAYIGSKNVVHGDLSARNVLLDEYYTCKIGDFGLSRKLYEYQKYVKTSQEPLPWKWMAYESLTRMEFTSKSDVWSYGVTLWEIYSLGGSPYGGLNWTTEFGDELRNGLRLTRPQYASEEIYNKMLECWTLDAGKRPTFEQMAEFFEKLSNTDYTLLSE